MVTVKVGDQNIDFMVDTGAELSVVTKPVAPLSKKTTTVTGVSGEEMIKSFCQPRKCQMGGGTKCVSAQYPSLLGGDLFSKLGAQVTFSPEERPTFWTDSMTYLPSLSVPTQDEWRLHETLKAEPGGLEEYERANSIVLPLGYSDKNLWVFS